jgi:hypothetical protein
MGERGSGENVDRRAFLKGLGAVGSAAVLGGVAAACTSSGSGAEGGTTSAKQGPTTTSLPATTTTTVPAVHYDALELPVATWVVEENARPGTKAWLVSGSPPHGIEGYADRVSAQPGEEVTLYVNTVARSVEVEAYRIGWYQGYGARFVANLGRARGVVQTQPSLTPTVNMIECHWRETLRFAVGQDWPSGYYLLKLLGSNGYNQWVPLVVRDDSSRAAVLVQSSVTTWQAYNLWGGFSLYGTGPGGYGYPDRSRVVSFDRPYPANWENGSADFFGNEYPLVALLERHGVDVTYWTDLDLHERSHLLANHRCLVSLGHDEYWSAEMRRGAQGAVDAGLNFAVLGANCCYRHIRLQDSPLGTSRRQVCYKDGAEDPLYGVDDAEVTSNWEDGPVPRPESQLIGVEYQSFGGSGDLVVADAASFVFSGTGLTDGSRIAGVVGSEFDAYVPQSPSPANLEILCHAATGSANGPATVDTGYYTVNGGGGVFASGTASWINRMWANTGILPTPFAPTALPATAAVSRITLNVLAAFSKGPASLTVPSSATWQRFYTPGSGTLAPVAATSH